MNKKELESLEKQANNLYVSDELKNMVDYDLDLNLNVFYVKINEQVYDLFKYKNTETKTTFKFLLEKPQFKKIILSSFDSLDLYVDNIRARTFIVDKENINIKIKKLKNIYKVELSLKKSLNKKEILWILILTSLLKI